MTNSELSVRSALEDRGAQCPAPTPLAPAALDKSTMNKHITLGMEDAATSSIIVHRTEPYLGTQPATYMERDMVGQK